MYENEKNQSKIVTSVADDIGVDEKTVRNIFNDHVAKLKAQTDFRTPKWLGIDEVHLLKNYRCVVILSKPLEQKFYLHKAIVK